MKFICWLARSVFVFHDRLAIIFIPMENLISIIYIMYERIFVQHFETNLMQRGLRAVIIFLGKVRLDFSAQPAENFSLVDAE